MADTTPNRHWLNDMSVLVARVYTPSLEAPVAAAVCVSHVSVSIDPISFAHSSMLQDNIGSWGEAMLRA